MLDGVRNDADFIDVNGIKTELIRRGSGPPLLFLHPNIGLHGVMPALDALARKWTVLAPSHPGFGRSEMPRSFRYVDDIAYFYLDFLDQLDLRNVLLVGCGFGGWVAAEIAVKSTERLSKIVLANAVGIKVSGPEKRDIVDIFSIGQAEFERLSFHDPAKHIVRFENLGEDGVLATFRNREATSLFCWSPYMHNPRLADRLHRIRKPALMLWGASDRIAPAEYGQAYCSRIPGARFVSIEKAGHYPHVEQPEAFAGAIADFAG